jgi:soluble lytic murein transglycosylase-like protein
MGAVKAALALGLWLCTAPAAASPVDRWSSHIEEAASRFQVPAAWIRRVMQAESGGRTRLGGRPIESSAGALGLMQLMPGTWREMRAIHGLGHDPHDPRDNILAGTAYLRAMYERFGYPGLFAAYNAGPARYANHLATGRRLPAETVAYAAKLGSPLAGPDTGITAVAPDRTEASAIFVAMSASSPSGAAGDSGPAPASNPLFVRLGTDRADRR